MTITLIYHARLAVTPYLSKILHDFRRSAVQSLEWSGVPRSTAMAVVGHKLVSICQRYAVVDEAILQEGGWTPSRSSKRPRLTLKPSAGADSSSSSIG
jgi:hypothetical protein